MKISMRTNSQATASVKHARNNSVAQVRKVPRVVIKRKQVGT